MGNFNENLCACNDEHYQRNSINVINPKEKANFSQGNPFFDASQNHDMGDNCWFLNQKPIEEENPKSFHFKRQITFGKEENQKEIVKKNANITNKVKILIISCFYCKK